MPQLCIGIAGAGLLGRLLAWRLARAGHRVSVFDPAPGPLPRFDGQQAAGFTAAGMLSPLAELDNSSAEVAALGWRSIALWRGIVAALPARPHFAERGSLLLAHRSDAGAAQRVLARLARAAPGTPQARALTLPELAGLEPALQGAAQAWLLPQEGQIDTVATLNALYTAAADVVWHWGTKVVAVAAGTLTLDAAPPQRFDLVFDVRGTGARPELRVCGEAPGFTPRVRGRDAGFTPRVRARDVGFTSLVRARDVGFTPRVRGGDVGFTPLVRGVRGEIVWLHAPGHGLTRPVRLLHPRHRVYLVPRSGDTVLVGASEVESEDRSPVSLRSAVELMAAAHSVMPSLAEARIMRLDTNLRPALPDNAPRTEVAPGVVRINGLFRHGWLLAPALVEDALHGCGLGVAGPLREARA